MNGHHLMPTPSGPMPLLEVRDLRVRLPTARGPADALRELSFTLGRGETLGVVGESGCGKSMLALALMGLLPEGAVTSGSIRLHARATVAGPAAAHDAPAAPDALELVGLPDAALCRLRGNRLGMVFQEPMTALNPVHTIGRQVAEPLRRHRGLDARAARAQALRLLEQVQLPQAAQRLDAYPHQLSGGQRQRVVIAIALACEPDLLIADEPTTALDVTLQREILRLIAELVAQRGMALMLISHDLGVIAQNVQRTMVMYGGVAVESGTTRDILTRPAHPYTQGLLAARPRLGSPRHERLRTIAGRVPELADLPAGCPFAPRCDWRRDDCEAALPAPASAHAGHAVRCVRWHEIRNAGGLPRA